jgi:drug/metabolite transporter (DMT)-like permease
VILVSQTAGLLLAGTLALAIGGDLPSARRLVTGLLAGAVGVGGLIAFYRGLKVGAMGVVAPIAATAVLVPLAVGLVHGERPSAVQDIGIALALAGVVAASLEPEREALRDRRLAAGAVLALIAALAFGVALTGLNSAAKGGAAWGTLAMRVAGVPLVACLVVSNRVSLRGTASVWPLLVSVGILDAGATVLFGVAGNHGLLSIVAVLASLYPVIIIALARVVVHERLSRVQLVGAATALVGVALISAG